MGLSREQVESLGYVYMPVRYWEVVPEAGAHFRYVRVGELISANMDYAEFVLEGRKSLPWRSLPWRSPPVYQMGTSVVDTGMLYRVPTTACPGNTCPMCPRVAR